jgi:hypothetical protein
MSSPVWNVCAKLLTCWRGQTSKLFFSVGGPTDLGRVALFGLPPTGVRHVMLWNDRFQMCPKARDIPLAVAQRVEQSVFGLVPEISNVR